MKQKELSVYDAKHVMPEIAVIGIGLPFDFIKVLLCLGLSFPVLYHILMYIISIELVRFSALSPMVPEGTTSQFAQPNRHGGYYDHGIKGDLYLSDLKNRLFLCQREIFQIYRVHVFSFIL